MQLGKPKYMLYAQTGPTSSDFFTAQAWDDEALEEMLTNAPGDWDVTVYVMRDE